MYQSMPTKITEQKNSKQKGRENGQQKTTARAMN
jgi:hypothetical protein